MPGLVYALLVAIDDYPNPAHRLAGCKNDALDLEETLRARVPDGILRVEKLLDRVASREAVIERFSRHLGQAGKGDTAVFYYAGHGSQERSPEEFWLVEPDRLDETLVLSDSREPGKWDLADKELAALIREVAARGAHVVIILDCCHSGSGTRALADLDREKVRRFPVDSRLRPMSSFIPQAQAPSGRNVESGWDLGDAGRHVLLAACRDCEEAAEYTGGGQKRGAFTYHLLRVLREWTGVATYRELTASTRVRLISAVSNQTPQIEAIDDADLDRPFLGGAMQPRSAAFVVSQDSGAWWMDAGRIHGIPAPAGAERTRVAIYPAGASPGVVGAATAVADVVDVEAARSRLEIVRGELVAGKDYRANVFGLPAPSRTVQLEGAAAEGAAMQAAIAGSPYVIESKGNADFIVECQPGEFNIRRGSDRRALTATSATPAAALADVEHIARWMTFAELENPASAIEQNEIEVKVFEGSKGNVELPGDDLRVTATRAGGALTPPRFRVRIANKGTRTMYVGLLALDELFGCSTDLFAAGTIKLESGEEAWALDGRALRSRIPEPLRREGRTESRDTMKIIASTVDFDIRHAWLHALAAPRTRAAIAVRGTLDRVLARGGTRTISADSDADTIQDFRTYTISVTTVEPSEGAPVSNAVSAKLAAGVRIDPHPSFQAMARIAAYAEARSDLGRSILPPMFRNALEGTETIQFTAGRGNSPALSVLELTDITGYETVTGENPLNIRLPERMGDGEIAVAVAYDGEDYLILGRGATRDGETLVRLSRLPHPLSRETRSLTGSIKILFQKFAGSVFGTKYEYPVVAAATWNGKNKPEYEKDPNRIRQRIAAASRVIIFVHGIIGDTLAMGAKLPPAAGDVYLTVDYENLHTTIEQNAEALKNRLIDYGLREGHGKEVVVVAHSMGGLLARWFVEKLGGNKIVSRVILCGTPNAGSPWSTIEDWATGIASLAMNGLTRLSWEAALIGRLLGAIERIDNSLDEMRPDSTFLRVLATLPDPGIPYTVVAGNTSLVDTADLVRVSRILKKVLYKTTSWAFLSESNDIAVSVASIHSVGAGWKKEPEKLALGSDHLSYFGSSPSVEALEKLLGLKQAAPLEG